jgi:hypothetical protein
MSRSARTLIVVASVCGVPGSAWATTGISALGRLLDILLLAIAALGLVLLSFICMAIIERAPAKDRPRSPILAGVGYGYLLGALTMYYLGEPGPICLALGLVVVLVAIALAALQTRPGVPRAFSIAGVLVGLVIMTYLQPHALAFHNRVYVDNLSELQGNDLDRPTYWRVMATADGRRFLDLRSYVRNNRIFDDGRIRFSAPLVFTPVDRAEDRKLYRVNEIDQTTGAWGWSSRKHAAVTVPIFGRAEVPRYERKPVGTALLLDETADIDARYLFEAVSERAPRIDGWIRELIDRGTDPSYVDPESAESVLMRAIHVQPLSTVEYLVANGADVNYVAPRTGASALKMAGKKSRAHVDLLAGAGADADHGK